MRSTISSIGKNLILLGLLFLTITNFFNGWFSWKDLLAIQGILGLAYIFLSCYEFLNTQYKASLPVQRYAYFSSSYVMLRVLKMAVFTGVAVVLFFSGNRIKYLYPVCVIVVLTEALVMILKYRRELCFVSIYANYLMFAQDKITRLFASAIEVVEFRHDIFYFVKKDGKAINLKLEHIAEKERFVSALNEWLQRNKINIGEESVEKLKSLKVQ